MAFRKSTRKWTVIESSDTSEKYLSKDQMMRADIEIDCARREMEWEPTVSSTDTSDDEPLPPIRKRQKKKKKKTESGGQDSWESSERASPSLHERIKATTETVEPSIESAPMTPPTKVSSTVSLSSIIPIRPSDKESSMESSMTQLMERKGFEIKDEVTFSLLCKVLSKQDEILLRLDELEKHSTIADVNLDVHKMTSVEDLKNLPPNLSRWFARQGGTNAKEFVSRCLGNLMSVDLQNRINRTGSRGKEKLPQELEDQLKDAVYRFFPHTTAKDVELYIMRFLKNAADRAGLYSRPSRHSSGSI